MFVVLFEVQPRADQWDAYLGLARWLRPEIEAVDGFIDNERFASRRTSGRLLSLSTWRDEKALVRWRTLAVHHAAQQRGRSEIFADYHLRVAEVTSDTHFPDDRALGHDRFDVTSSGSTAALIVERQAEPGGQPANDDEGPSGLVDVEWYDSITAPGKTVVLAAWPDEARLQAWLASRPRGGPSTVAPTNASIRYRAVRVIRDYGMRDRSEAPQYYPPVPDA